MKLYERFAERGYHTSIATTFGIDFDAYENVVLPRLRGAGCHNNILLADGAMLTQALETATTLPRYAGRLYTVSGVRADAVFHPKLFLQLGREAGRMIVSSANMTASGLAGNLELAGEMTCDTGESGERQLIRQAWRYVLRLSQACGQALSDQIGWTESRAAWLRGASQEARPATLSDGTQAALLTTGGGTGIGTQFIDLVDDGAVARLIVVSPYWDPDLRALSFLSQRLSAKVVSVLIDPETRAFPASALRRLKGVGVFDRGEFRKGRFLHAKTVIAQTKKFDHVLYGSANCTIAALGSQGSVGANEEVCLYRRLPVGTTLDALELGKLLGKGREIDPAALKPAEAKDDLDLKSWAMRTPGRFESQFDTLIWAPPAGFQADAAVIELMNGEGGTLPCRLTPLPNLPDKLLRFQISDSVQRPAFARLRYADGTASAPAIIISRDMIRETVREARSKPAEQAALQVGEGTEEGLWLIDALETLIAAEQDLERKEEAVSIVTRKKKKDAEAAPAQFRKLSYEAFIAGRRAREQTSSVARNSLGGSDASLVRGFLNRLLDLGGDDDPGSGVDDEEALRNSFNLGDETANAEEAIERGEPLEAIPPAAPSGSEEQQERLRLAAQRKATREQIADAAAHFSEGISERKTAGHLTTVDILRLRVLLMIVAAAGWAGHGGDASHQKPRSSLQVLPLEGSEQSWPRILGRILFGFFSGTDPAIRHIRIDALHDQLPDDILECWATCFWAVQACLAVKTSGQECATLARFITPLAERVYRLTGLTRDELLSGKITTVMHSLGERFSARLGIDATAIRKAHEALTERMLARPGAVTV